MYSSTSGPCNSVGKNRLEPARQKLRKFSVGQLKMFSKVLKRILVRVFFSVAKMNQQRTHHVWKSGIGTNSLRTVQLDWLLILLVATVKWKFSSTSCAPRRLSASHVTSQICGKRLW
jgi:hypothetical protein